MFAVLWLTDKSNLNLSKGKSFIGVSGIPLTVSDQLQHTADSWEHDLKRIVDSSNLESPLSTAANYSWEKDDDTSLYPNKIIVPLDVPQRRTIWKAPNVSTYGRLSPSTVVNHLLNGYPLQSLSWTHHRL